MPFSAHEYYAEVSSIAQELLKRELEDGDELYDIAHEAVDGHQWIIYNRYHFGILKHTSNEDAYFEDFGELTCDSFTDFTVKVAFAAFLHDITQSVEAQRDSAQRTYKVVLTDLSYEDHNGDDLPTEFSMTVAGEESEEDAVQAALTELQDVSGETVEDYNQYVSLTVTFPE